MEIQKRTRELSWWVTLETAARIGTAFHPAAAIAGNALFTIIDQVRKKRSNDFLLSFESEVEEQFGKIKTEYVSNQDFQELFLKSANKIADERSDLKRVAYKNILLYGTFNAPELSDLEDNIRLVDQVGENHLRLLHFVVVPGHVQSNIIGGGVYHVLHEKFPNWSRDYLEDITAELEAFLLIDGLSSNMHTMMSHVSAQTIINTATRRGKRFIEFILSS